MAYANPAQLFEGYFRPTVRTLLPIIPHLLAADRAKQTLAEAQFRSDLEQPRIASQARLYNAQAVAAEAANKMRSQILGGEGGLPAGMSGIPVQDIQKSLLYKSLGISEPTQPALKSIYDPDKGAWVYGIPKAGAVVKPEAEEFDKIDYWIRGPQGWRKTSERVPKETYNQRWKELEAQGARLDEPPEIDIQKEIDKYKALAPEKLAQLDSTLKARGVDTSKWNQQQKLWYQSVKDRASREVEVIKFTAKSLREAREGLSDVENMVFQESQRIAVGQPPTYFTVPQNTPQAQPQPGPLPIKPQAGQTPQPQPQPAQVQPQATVMPKRLPNETIDQYIQRVGQ